jgi:hypothetical protein
MAEMCEVCSCITSYSSPYVSTSRVPTLARPSNCWTAVACLGKVDALPRRAMTRTVFLQLEAGVKKVPFAVTRVTSLSWLLPSQPCSDPTAKTVGIFTPE